MGTSSTAAMFQLEGGLVLALYPAPSWPRTRAYPSDRRERASSASDRWLEGATPAAMSSRGDGGPSHRAAMEHEGGSMFAKSKAFQGFSVPDLSAAKKFYGESLGLAEEPPAS